MPVPAFSMARRVLLPLAAAALLGLALAGPRWLAAPAPEPQPAGAPAAAFAPPDSSRLRGVNWVGGDSITLAELQPLRAAHVSWLAQTPFGWQNSVDEPLVHLRTAAGRGRSRDWGESDAGLAHTARLARQLGIRTLLKPHIWVRGRGAWPGDINMKTDADWQAWFASYSAFILHYARLAETHKMEALCLGTELQHAAAPTHTRRWRALIRQVRRVYHGQLTYAANWSGEYRQVPFWAELDFVGIQAYFPLTPMPNPPLDTLLQAWQPHLRALAAWQKKVGKPIVFTEAGYKATPDAAARPWEWPERTAAPAPPDEGTQARCYEAFFRSCWPQPWLRGVFIWKWYPGLKADGPARRHADFTPQHKPAEAVMRRWYSQ